MRAPGDSMASSVQETIMKDLAGKVAVITGAGSGFGREFARIAVRERMSLVLADVQADALETIAAECRGQGTEVLAVRTDVSRAADVQQLADAAIANFGALSCLRSYEHP